MTPTLQEQALSALDDYHQGIRLLIKPATTLSNLLAGERDYRKIVALNTALAESLTPIYQDLGNHVNNALSKFYDPQEGQR